jgi:hypothetical protein
VRLSRIHIHILSGIVILLFVIAMSACSNMKEPRGWRAFIKPLKVGNEWIGTITKFDSTGAILRTQRFAEKIVSDTVIDGEKWFLSRFFKGNDSSENRLFTNRKGGLWSRAVSFDLNEVLQPEFFAKYYVDESDTFRTLDNQLVTVRKVDEHLKTRVGEYECIVYRQTYPEDAGYRDDYYAADVGLLRAESYRNRPGRAPCLDWRYEIDIIFLPNSIWWHEGLSE